MEEQRVCSEKMRSVIEIKKCAVLGNAVAGLCVQKRGGIPAIPTKEAVLEFMQK